MLVSQAFRTCVIWTLAGWLIQPASAAASEQAAVDGRRIFAALSQTAQGLRWDGLSIGMGWRQLEQVAGAAPASEVEPEANLCGGFTVRRVLHGRELDIDLVGEPGAETVAGIFVHWQGEDATWLAPELVLALRQTIPGLVYRPSRHAPGLLEHESPMPLFQLGAASEMVILVKPGEGFYLGLDSCLG